MWYIKHTDCGGILLLKDLRKSHYCADAELNAHFITLTAVLEQLNKLQVIFIEQDVEVELIRLQEKLRDIGKKLLAGGENRTPISLVTIADAFLSFRCKLKAPGKVLISSRSSLTSCWGSAGARDAFSRVLSKDMGNLKLDSSSCTVPEYQLSLQLRTAVLALGAHWVLTCHDRDIPQAAGEDHSGPTTVVHRALCHKANSAVQHTSRPGIL